MKILLSICFIIFGVLSPSIAEDLFHRVEIRENYWEVTFPKSGERYKIHIGAKFLGTSGYEQILRLEHGEPLELHSENSRFEVQLAHQNDVRGILITRVYKDSESGELKIRKFFQRSE